jgi:hypothetical protein
MAQLSVSGTVTDSTTAAAINGATVKMIHCNLITSTNASGAFTITRASTGIIGCNTAAIAPSVPVILSAKGEIRLNLSEPSRVTVKTFSVGWKQIGTMERTLGAGDHSIMPARTNSGIYLYQVVVNGKAYTLQHANVEGRAYAAQQANVKGSAIASQRLEKSAASLVATWPDSIFVTAPGHFEKFLGVIDSVASGLTVQLKQSPSSCTAFMDSAVTGWNTEGYFLYNNMWNATYVGQYKEYIYACSYHNWCVVANMANSDFSGQKRSQPNIQKNFGTPVAINSLTSFSSTFEETSPHFPGCIYQILYNANFIDVAGNSNIQIVVDNAGMGADGTPQATHTFGGHTYTPRTFAALGGCMFVTTANFSSGTIDLLEMFNYAIAQGWMPATTTIGQLGFGADLVSMNGRMTTALAVTNYSVTIQ